MTVAGLNDNDELHIDSEVVPVLSRMHAVMAERDVMFASSEDKSPR